MTRTPSPSEQQRFVEFARRWARYGGGSAEDVFMEFGLTEADYFTRLTHILGNSSHGLDPLTATVVTTIAQQRLAAGPTPPGGDA